MACRSEVEEAGLPAGQGSSVSAGGESNQFEKFEGIDLRSTLSAKDVLAIVCKYCRRNASQVGWARPDGGRECGECRNMIRCVIVGTPQQKKEQKNQLASKCADDAYHKFYMSDEGPLMKFKNAPIDVKRQMGKDVLEWKVSVVHDVGFLMREVRGVFWPTKVAGQYP